jgi:hypothetical protein
MQLLPRPTSPGSVPPPPPQDRIRGHQHPQWGCSPTRNSSHHAEVWQPGHHRRRGHAAAEVEQPGRPPWQTTLESSQRKLYLSPGQSKHHRSQKLVRN